MISFNLFYPYQPARPCLFGIDDIAAAMIGGTLISGIGSVASSIIGSNKADDINAQNRSWEASEYDRRFAMGEDQLIRSEQRQSSEFDRRLSEVMTVQNEEYDRRMNAYETPAAKARLLRQAGFNPLSAVSDGAGSPSVVAGDPGNLQGNAVSSPSVPSVGMMTPQDTGMLAMVDVVGKGIKAFAEAQKYGAETREIQTLLKGKLEKLLAEGQGQKLLNAGQELNNLLQEKTLSASVGKALSEWQQGILRESLLAKEGDLLDVKKWHEEALAILAKHQGDLTAEQYTQAVIRTGQYAQELSAYVANLKSQTALNNANTGVAEATKQQIENYNYIHGNKEVQRAIMEEFSNNALQSALRNELTEKQISQLRYAVSQAAYADDMKEFTYWSNQVQGYIGTLGDVAAKLFGAGKLAKLLGGSAPGSNNPSSLFVAPWTTYGAPTN